jgi:hypothetical protein
MLSYFWITSALMMQDVNKQDKEFVAEMNPVKVCLVTARLFDCLLKLGNAITSR